MFWHHRWWQIAAAVAVVAYFINDTRIINIFIAPIIAIVVVALIVGVILIVIVLFVVVLVAVVLTADVLVAIVIVIIIVAVVVASYPLLPANSSFGLLFVVGSENGCGSQFFHNFGSNF